MPLHSKAAGEEWIAILSLFLPPAAQNGPCGVPGSCPKRMFQRQMSNEAVLHVLDTGATIEQYLDDFPYPSRLVLGWWASKPIHVVVADNADDEIRIVIAVYQPDLEEWKPGFRRRRKP